MAGRINIIGSSHIAKESVERVKKEIESFSPDIVALELDARRAYALMHKDDNEKQKKDYWGMIKSVGFKGFVFAVVGSFVQKKLGDMVGIEPGAEMKNALIAAKSKGIKVVYIDQDVEVTLKRFSNAITWKEKWQFVKDIFEVSVSPKKRKLKFDLKTVPDDKIINEMIKEVEKKYPNIHRVLVEERNVIMAKRLYALSRKYPEGKILAVVGAGHKEEILRIIKKLEKEN
jgi:pheromone shutdown-related protein TraB